MTVEEKIMQKAKELFDVARATRLHDGGVLLVLGLESTPKQNLDEFGRKFEKFMMYGFRLHAAPSLEALVNYIHKKGFSAELCGVYGYPHEGAINLKNEAIRAGLGFRGKNTLVLNPKYGHRLRFMGIKTSAQLVKQEYRGDFYEFENPVCRDCSICINICPIKILEPYRMTRPSTCLSNITPQTKDGRSMLCDKCVSKCPAGKKARRLKKKVDE